MLGGLERVQLGGALVVQLVWKLYCDNLATDNDPVYSLLKQENLSHAERWKSRQPTIARDSGIKDKKTAGSEEQWRAQVIGLLQDLSKRVENIEAAQPQPTSDRSGGKMRLSLPGRQRSSGNMGTSQEL